MKNKILPQIIFLLTSVIGLSQTETSNNEKINLQSTTGVSLFQSSSTNGIWATGTITADRFGIFEDATSTKERFTILSGGNLGIGTTNPTSRLVVQSNSGQTESLAQFRVGDASSDYFQIANSTGSAGQFIPLLKGYHDTDNRYALSIMGSSSDAMDSGTNALVNFNARRYNSAVQNRPLFVWTNYDQKMMTMTANGNIGIGVTNPSSKLEVKGVIKTLNTDGRFVNLFTSGDGNSYMNISGGSANSRFGFQVDGSSKMSIMKNGSIGIGTSSPVANTKLTVVGHVSIGGNGNYRLRTRHIDGKHYSNSGLDDLYLNYNTGKHVRVGFGGQNSNLYVSGRVGIGTNNPDADLAVKGKIHTQEVKVDLNGAVAPDYVFLEDYNLKTIDEVENYIEKEGHLPNIPSAKEMEQNGIELKTMNLKLLEKIEELTLYMIEQNKKTELLQKEVQLLKEKIKSYSRN